MTLNRVLNMPGRKLTTFSFERRRERLEVLHARYWCLCSVSHLVLLRTYCLAVPNTAGALVYYYYYYYYYCYHQVRTNSTANKPTRCSFLGSESDGRCRGIYFSDRCIQLSGATLRAFVCD
jgi:hypothetical protein